MWLMLAQTFFFFFALLCLLQLVGAWIVFFIEGNSQQYQSVKMDGNRVWVTAIAWTLFFVLMRL